MAADLGKATRKNVWYFKIYQLAISQKKKKEIKINKTIIIFLFEIEKNLNKPKMSKITVLSLKNVARSDI